MNRTVLIVDDDPAMVTLLTKQLTSAGYTVLSAENGLDALRVLRAEGAQIVLSDWCMPQMSGIELCQTVRAEEGIGFIYFIILTAHAEKDHVIEALDSGANDFLIKPVHHQELLSRINAGMRIVTLEAELTRQSYMLYRANAEFALLNQKLERMATTDELTGLPNRREAMNRLKKLWADGVRHGHPLSCIMVDIDHFKRCNDTYGHDVGDLVLQRTAWALERACRQGDSVCRLGGEEFLILCPNTPAVGAREAAERFRRDVAANIIQDGGLLLRVTISLGVAEMAVTSSNPDDLFKRADGALYEAKRAGRNCTRVAAIATDPPEPPLPDTAEVSEDQPSLSPS